MKRRKFLKITGIGLAVSPVISKAERIFGTPDSSRLIPVNNISSHITLPLSKAQIPNTIFNEVSKYSLLWSKVLSDKNFNIAFFRNPRQVMIDSGLTDLANHKKNELSVLLCLRDKNVLDALEVKDYRKFFENLKPHITKTEEYVSNSRLDEINTFIQNKGLSMKSEFDKPALRASQPVSAIVKDNELAFMAASICGGETGLVAAAAVFVVVAVVAVTYVGVGVNVAAALNVAAYISVVAKTAVATSGVTPTSITGSQKGWLYTAANTAEIPDLTKVSYSSLLTAANISKLSGDIALNRISITEMVKREINVSIRAAENAGMVHILPAERENVIQSMTNYTLKIMGVDK